MSRILGDRFSLERESPSVNVLVVDDNPANRCAFETLLRPMGYPIFLASSGEEALHFVTHRRFAVILLDVRMPILDGLETARLLRRKPFSRSTPILFMSAHDTTALEVRRMSLEEPTGFVHSSMDSELLLWKVKSYVRLHVEHERLRLQAAHVWQASERFRSALLQRPNVEPELWESGERLLAYLHDLKEALSKSLGADLGRVASSWTDPIRS